MKRLFSALLLLAFVFLSSCTAGPENLSDQTSSQAIAVVPSNLHEVTLGVKGMTCTSCALGVEYQLKQVDGVIDAKISYEEGKGYVTYDADKTTPDIIAQASDVYPAEVLSDKII